MLSYRWGNVSYKLLAVAWFFYCWSKVYMFCGWLNCWINDDQQPVLQVFVQWVMPHSRLNKGQYDFTQNQFWPFAYYCCPRLCLSICSYATVCQAWACPCDNLWPVQAKITKYGKQFGQDPNSFRGLTFTFKVKFNLKVKISGFTTRVNTQPIQHHCSHKRCDTFRDPYSKKKS